MTTPISHNPHTTVGRGPPEPGFLDPSAMPVYLEGKTFVDLIEIGGLRLRCVIGCRDEERRDRSDVVIDLTIGADTRPAAASDGLADAWNYRTPIKAIIGHVEDSAYRTVEALATAIARILIIDHGAPHVRVRAHKPGALRFTDTVGVVIERRTADFAATGLARAGSAGGSAEDPVASGVHTGRCCRWLG